MYTKIFPITPDSDTDLEVVPRAIYIGGDGTLSISVLGDDDNTPVNFVGLKAGTVLQIRPKRVLVVAEGGATNILGLTTLV